MKSWYGETNKLWARLFPFKVGERIRFRRTSSWSPHRWRYGKIVEASREGLYIVKTTLGVRLLLDTSEGDEIERVREE